MDQGKPNGREESFPVVAGYVLGYLIALALVPFFLHSIPETADSKVRLIGSAAFFVVLLMMRVHYRSIIRGLLSVTRAKAVLRRLDFGGVMILAGVLLAGSVMDARDINAVWLLALGVAVALGCAGLVMVQRAQHVWFASSFLSRQHAPDDIDQRLIQAAEELARSRAKQRTGPGSE